jgi:hypothetical protein
VRDVDAGTAEPRSRAGSRVASAGARALFRRWVPLVLLTVVVVVPLVIGVVAMRRPRWIPVLDLAMTELRVRDVGTGDTPLIGLPGRLGSPEQQGSHPGPLSFYALAPVYRLLGSTAWALQVGTVVIHTAATLAALWIARRRGGMYLALVMAVVIVVVMRGFGITALAQPWNPYLPLVTWLVVLLAVWSVLCGDVVMLPIAVAGASLCAQTHIPYLGLALGLGVITTVSLVRQARHDASTANRIKRWALLSLGIGILVWTPALIDEATRDPGNLSILSDHLLSPDEEEEPAGFAEGGRELLLHLNVGELFTTREGTSGALVEAFSLPPKTLVPGIIVLAVWLGAAALAMRMRHAPLRSLHIVIAASLALGWLSMSRILGKTWYYLMLWSWWTTALIVVSIGWTAVELARRSWPRERQVRAAYVGQVALLVLLVGMVAVLTTDAPGAKPPDARLSAQLERALPGTARALDEGVGAADGRDGRYVVTWSDSVAIGAQGYGLVSELERLGFDARVPESAEVPVTSHRVIEPSDATAQVELATGPNIATWRARDDAIEVAYVDGRTDDERARFDRIRSNVIAELGQLGLHDVAQLVDSQVFSAAIDPRVPVHLQRELEQLLNLGLPVAVFIVPPPPP